MLAKRPVVNRLYEFGPFVLNPAEHLLIKNDTPVDLSPKAFDLLVVLAERSGMLVTKDDLIESVWQGAFVEEGNISYNVSLLRKALGDDAASPRYVKTVAKRGYRFIAPTRVLESSNGQPANKKESSGTHELPARDLSTGGLLPSPVKKHFLHLLVATFLYALYYSVSFMLEIAYEYETYGTRALTIAPLVFLWIMGTSWSGLGAGLKRTASGLPWGVALSLAVLIGAALLLYLALALFLPNIAITRASFQTYPAQGAFLKSVYYVLPMVVLFVVLPSHFIVAREREVLLRGSDGFTLDLQAAGAGIVHIRTWWLALALLCTFCITLAASAHLFENLQVGPNTGLFIQLSQWRFLLYFLLGLECLLWYQQAQRRTRHLIQAN
ncbi:MAG TPA: transcriptional regulator [Pyrinomonadaceae bacterium]|nr:transcriptional regulator [Pyrinomonadaceae bacterium]